ncbi:MAG: helix-turn-helix domain-containing protein [Asticcacaulis sp.]
MPIRIALEAALERSGLKAKEVARRAGLSETQLSLFRSGKVKGIRFATLARLCAVMGCGLDDIMSYEFAPEDLIPPRVPDDE